VAAVPDMISGGNIARREKGEEGRRERQRSQRKDRGGGTGGEREFWRQSERVGNLGIYSECSS